MARSYQGTSSHTLDIALWDETPPGPRLQSCGIDVVTSGSCCAGFSAHFLPIGPAVPLSAGDVAIRLRDRPLATLVAPNYPEVDDATWNGGDVLEVSAPGGNVASFSGSLVTPKVISGVTPAFGSSPVIIPTGADFRVSWMPEGRDGEEMQLQINMIDSGGNAPVILCDVPDSTGSVVVDASLFARMPSGATGGIHLTRSITSTAYGANVSVTLIGDDWLDALAATQ